MDVDMTTYVEQQSVIRYQNGHHHVTAIRERWMQWIEFEAFLKESHANKAHFFYV